MITDLGNDPGVFMKQGISLLLNMVSAQQYEFVIRLLAEISLVLSRKSFSVDQTSLSSNLQHAQFSFESVLKLLFDSDASFNFKGTAASPRAVQFIYAIKSFILNCASDPISSNLALFWMKGNKRQTASVEKEKNKRGVIVVAIIIIIERHIITVDSTQNF